MKKYRIINTDVLYNGKLYKEGDIIELNEKEVMGKIGIIYEEVEKDYDIKKKGENK